MDPAEAKAQAEMMGVALAQPHRRGNPDRRAGEPLYDVWLSLRLRDELYEAGSRYAEIVHRDRSMMGIGVACVPSAEGISVTMSDGEREAAEDAARKQRQDADAVIRAIMPRAVNAMVKLCYDRLPSSPHDEGLIKDCLWALARHFGLVKMGINTEKRS